MGADCAGADLLQVYAGFIYGGPLWLYQLNAGLAERFRAGGFSSIADAVGSAARSVRPYNRRYADGPTG